LQDTQPHPHAYHTHTHTALDCLHPKKRFHELEKRRTRHVVSHSFGFCYNLPSTLPLTPSLLTPIHHKEEPCTSNACCLTHPLVNQDPNLGAHFDSGCPTMDGDTSLPGCVAFTSCRYVSPQCTTDACCQTHPLVNHAVSVRFNPSCPRGGDDPSVVGCVEWTLCQYVAG